ncbi:Aim6p [Lachancea thermotolerans CBS 6340]|uniref:Altered inheritance of mitochondria protein 6 n=1 Tax=Lachancea thermotolerans (strain ATCC 56472 / CBS 6340 / NRRL Y-8284) TaxID=559295 RepID=AIM6_LACTC|nr:KLTH0B08206p [Lachancea thermotolerans CBS 6340]C5DD45.1 RecName: Full=Altered inheritance of mitochondria protein 6; Flags: Precursor [Lachancea thermotolerans CBS 6340]CAR21706.1 KLTH0B08206p [Lachancea thermotolerans CBS 6340]
MKYLSYTITFVKNTHRSCQRINKSASFGMIGSLAIGFVLMIVSFWAGTYVNVRGNPVMLDFSDGASSTRGDSNAHNNLGLTGANLLHFFKNRMSDTKDLTDARGVQVSRFYDEVVRYLTAENAGASTAEGTCFPEGSIVSKLTRNVNVVPKVHSHNDYWRDLPLFEALCHGIPSVEADVWLVDNDTQLAVGHNEAFLDHAHRTLHSLYTGPLLTMLNEVNCNLGDKDHKYGVFYSSPETTLNLYIDFKSPDSTQTYALLMDLYLKPLIDMGYLTYFDMDEEKVVWNPVTVILTGDYPTDPTVLDGQEQKGYYNTTQRFVFLDAPMHKLDEHYSGISVVASASLQQLLGNCKDLSQEADRSLLRQGSLPTESVTCVAKQVQKAQSLGLKTRIWGAPTWPESSKQKLWSQQIFDIGIDFLNTDDLEEVTHL